MSFSRNSYEYPNQIRNFNQENIIKQGTAKTTRSQCIVIDSRHRNTTIFPNPGKYRVHFNASDNHVGANVNYTPQNLYTIQLTECLLPKGFELIHPYLVLKIPELDNSLEGTSTLLGTSIAILIPDRIIGNTVHCRVNGQCYCFKKFVPTKTSLGKFTIEIYTPDGDIYDFKGSEEATSSSIQNMLIFELVTKHLSRKMFNETIV